MWHHAYFEYIPIPRRGNEKWLEIAVMDDPAPDGDRDIAAVRLSLESAEELYQFLRRQRRGRKMTTEEPNCKGG